MSAVRHVAVIGRDAAAWLTALALRRALGSTGVDVTVVELPTLLRPVDAFAAIPALSALHRLVGLREEDVLRAARGVPVLGQRFASWNGAGHEFLHGYDTQRPSIGDIEFLQFWVMARQQGMQVPWDEFSVAAVAAKQGRLARADRDADSLGDVGTGCHLDARGYVSLVRAAALQLGVHVLRASAFAAETDSGRIVAVTTDGGERVEADLFVDATGEAAQLLTALGEPGWEDWTPWLPCDRLLAASAPRLDPLPSFAQIAAFRAGWLGMFPLQDRTALMAAWHSDTMDENQMLATTSAATGVRIGEDAVFARFAAGMRPRQWIGNCVAIGDAAIALEPLDGLQLHLVHIGISHLISLFPVEAAAMPEAEGYDSVVGEHARNLRDFQIAHYRLNGREGEPFWDRARAVPGPASLDAKLSLFAARGQVPLYDEETFEAQNWMAIFLGHGLVPRDYTPLVDEVPRGEAIHKFQAFLGLIADEVRAMPSVAEYLEHGGAPKPERRGLY